MADILQFLDTKTLSNSGQPMPIIFLRTGEPLLDEDGTPWTITLAGQRSDQFQRRVRELQRERATELKRRGDKPVTSDELDQQRDHENLELLIACTVSWSFTTLGGEAFQPTPDNIRKFWEDGRWQWLRDQAMRFILNDANFLAPTSAPSFASPSTSSG